MTERLFVDCHVLQILPPSNINRDDAGSPKQAVYGGVRRARVSSQAWKRATRTAFDEAAPDLPDGVRTRRLPTLIAERVAARTGVSPQDALKVAQALLASMSLLSKKDADFTSYLLFFGSDQLDRLVNKVADRAGELAALSDADLKKAVAEIDVAEILGRGHPVAVALFGRMVADVNSLNVDAATQVAHALSTHEVNVDFDYFTAVDDENVTDSGAGMIGTIEFNSATLYRYATVAVHQLADNLGGDMAATTEALDLFLTHFVTSMPTGHINTFGHRTPPYLVSVVVRRDQPVNLVSAFEEPVRPAAAKAGFAEESGRRLAAELSGAAALWGLTPAYVASTYPPQLDVAEALGASRAFADVVKGTVEAVRGMLTSQA